MTTLGKIIGGGLPVGAYGGRREIMQCVAPAGPVYQAGTLSGNPLAMAAGLASLSALTPEKYAYLESLGEHLENGIRDALQATATNAQIQRWGSMWTLFFSPVPVENYDDAKRSDTKTFGRFFHAMLERGFYLPPSQFEAAFISLAHTTSDIDNTIEAIRESLHQIKN
jgi:glutamate-1-semialdehyde 2,1-aminomutase